MLRGKVAVVTGSTYGTGLRIACKLAAGGADLGLNGSGDLSIAEALRQEIAKTYGVRVAFSPANLSEPYGAAGLINDVTRALGRVDVLVNNAGMQHVAPVHEFPVEQWDSVIAINLTAVFLTTRLVLPQMFERKWGRIINIASVYGLVATANKAAYVASEHGVVGLTKCVALETAATGVTCNAICPSLTSALQRPRDNLAAPGQHCLNEAAAPSPGEANPSSEFATDRLGDVAKFLCSDAAAHISGVALPVDGGRLSR